MKYIRTKDGIYEIDETFKRDDQIAFFDNKEQTHGYVIGFFEGKDALKQADTIEELCDEFVWITPENEKHIKPKSGDGLWLLCCDYKDGHKIYGAIWTEWGLKYVAKMNEKGELKLL